jgi:hypothetical protein
MKNYHARGVTKSGKPIFSEDHEHQIVAAWLNAHGIFWIHSPNGGSRNMIEAKKLKRMGVKAGVSDFIIFDPPPKVLMAPGAVLELKALDGRVPTKEQQDFLFDMKARNWAWSWHRGSEAAIKWLEDYCGYGKR